MSKQYIADKLSYKKNRDSVFKQKKAIGLDANHSQIGSDIFEQEVSVNPIKNNPLKEKKLVIPLQIKQVTLPAQTKNETLDKKVEFFSNCWNKQLELWMTINSAETPWTDITPEQEIFDILDKQIENNQKLYNFIAFADDETFKIFVRIMNQETERFRRLQKKDHKSHNHGVQEKKRNSLFHNESQRDMFEKTPFQNFGELSELLEETRSLEIGILEGRSSKNNSKNEEPAFKVRTGHVASLKNETSSICKRNRFVLEEESVFKKICELKKKIVKKNSSGHFVKNSLKRHLYGE